MLNQTADLSSGLLTQLGNFFQKPMTTPGLPPGQTWEGAVPPTGNFPANNGLAVGSASGSALTGAASGLQAAAQSLLRQRMEALRQQGVGLRGAFAPPSPAPQWELEVTASDVCVNILIVSPCFVGLQTYPHATTIFINLLVQCMGLSCHACDDAMQSSSERVGIAWPCGSHNVILHCIALMYISQAFHGRLHNCNVMQFVWCQRSIVCSAPLPTVHYRGSSINSCNFSSRCHPWGSHLAASLQVIGHPLKQASCEEQLPQCLST